MDGQDVGTSCVCDGVSLSPSTATHTAMDKMLPQYAVARADGLHFYSPEEKVGVCPIDGSKIAMGTLPSPPMVYLKRPAR